MSINSKIGICIVTFNRNHGLDKLLSTLPQNDELEIVIVNDGEANVENVSSAYPRLNIHIINHEVNLGVGVSKNDGMDYLLKQGKEHIFIFEDDIHVKDTSVFERYIETSQQTGIKHFNYALHGHANINYDGSPKPRKIIKGVYELL